MLLHRQWKRSKCAGMNQHRSITTEAMHETFLHAKQRLRMTARVGVFMGLVTEGPVQRKG